MIEICKWYNDADSPVLFFIDDLSNTWVDLNDSGEIQLGEDWGYGKNKKNSSFKYLNEILLKDFQNIKTTFFLPVDARATLLKEPKAKQISKPINCDKETMDFFRSINNNNAFEIAYHGTTHGKSGSTADEFVQEWISYDNLSQALSKITDGKKIYQEVFGELPKGGKYCGYESNSFSDESINQSGFTWWCRYWNRGRVDKKGENAFEELDLRSFGSNNVVDIPSTICFDIFSREKNLKTMVKYLLRNVRFNDRMKQLDFLLKNKLVIGIQEHISFSRDDRKIQTPNIFDDTLYLRKAFKYLEMKNVWYCTGTELAEYHRLKKAVIISEVDVSSFQIDAKDINNKMLTIKVDSNITNIVAPNGEVYGRVKDHFNIGVFTGVYKFIFSEKQ